MPHPLGSRPAADAGAAIPFVRDDGGRAAAGYAGTSGDCCCRAVAIATGLPYQEVAELIAAFAAREKRRPGQRRSTAQNGVWRQTIHRLIASLGGAFTDATGGSAGGGDVYLRAAELPRRGRLVLLVPQHVVAVVHGVLHDTFDSSNGGACGVYGWWTLPWLGGMRQLDLPFAAAHSGPPVQLSLPLQRSGAGVRALPRGQAGRAPDSARGGAGARQ